VRSTPSKVLTTSIRPDSTAKSARSPPSWTANSPARRLTSAEVRTSRSSALSGSVENSGTARTSSIVSMNPVLRRSPAIGRIGRRRLLR
jgi:hypothetical protein